MIRSLFVVTATLVLLGCPGSRERVASSSRAASPEPGTEESIRELVIRDLMKHQSDLGRMAATSVCFVSFDNSTDPPQDFLDRFAGACAAIKPGSQIKPESYNPQSAPSARGKRIIFNVGPIQWQSDREADVQAGYYCGSLCAAGYHYRVVWADQGWTVAAATLLWIS